MLPRCLRAVATTERRAANWVAPWKVRKAPEIFILTVIIRRAEQIAHGLRPGLFVDLDQRLELAQMMGVAEGVSDAGQSVIRLEMVVHGDAARQSFRHGAALFRHPVEGQSLGRDRMQPLPFAGDAEAGFVEMAHRRLRGKGADMRRRLASAAALSSTQAVRLAAHR